jgi:hypothetical protein
MKKQGFGVIEEPGLPINAQKALDKLCPECGLAGENEE